MEFIWGAALELDAKAELRVSENTLGTLANRVIVGSWAILPEPAWALSNGIHFRLWSASYRPLAERS